MLEYKDIQEILPHRYPFLLVDRILEIEEGKRVVGVKNVTINEPFFAGHFPGYPIMPGVLILEAMAQVGGILLMRTLGVQASKKVMFFTGIDRARFRRPVVPGDQLRFEVELLQLRLQVCRMRGQATVDGKLVAEAEMGSMVVDRTPEKDASTPLKV
ncbi:MAG: 3-hydroxyacyl-ACP dehydratase FabZ [candidate division NC10 bacterium]|nr:3-hydroxyacyl-ACP dehydratase FabZ [candidate division NC10 bacterium]